jgi:hypothetical protein
MSNPRIRLLRFGFHDKLMFIRSDPTRILRLALRCKSIFGLQDRNEWKARSWLGDEVGAADAKGFSIVYQRLPN